MRSSSRKLAYVSPILRASEPSGAPPLLASAIRSAVRFAVSSPSTAKVPKTLRSGGISVLSYQPPFVNRKKSSPGFAERSIPARSRPALACRFPAADGGTALREAGEDADAHAAASSAVQRNGIDLAFRSMDRRLGSRRPVFRR